MNERLMHFSVDEKGSIVLAPVITSETNDRTSLKELTIPVDLETLYEIGKLYNRVVWTSHFANDTLSCPQDSFVISTCKNGINEAFVIPLRTREDS